MNGWFFDPRRPGYRKFFKLSAGVLARKTCQSASKTYRECLQIIVKKSRDERGLQETRRGSLSGQGSSLPRTHFFKVEKVVMIALNAESEACTSDPAVRV
ncbi:hypothetical protein MVEG_00487 [Podila verticillata NRRL 6337]|nr:hypothetical protein MVEG_00487 [Podila verticillata NRRL 6337]